METLTLEAFATSHLAGALTLSRAASWPHRLEDWSLLLSLSQGKVLLEGETVLATALATPMGPVTTISMIIVDAHRRGAGLGRRVMEAAMTGIDAEEWRLIATRDGLPLYQRMGFEALGDIVQHQGIAKPQRRGLPLPPRAHPDDLAALVALDRAATGMDRRGLYTALFAQGAIFVHREHGRPTAFAARRDFGRGIVIGPVIARDLAEAQSLIEPLLAAAEGQFMRIDTDEDSGLAAWIEARGLAHAGGGVKMRKGVIAMGPGLHRRFALAAQSLG